MADVTDKEATRSESNMEDSRGEDRETNRENREENGDTEHGRVLGKEGPDEDGGDRYQTEQHSTEWRGAMETGVSPFEFMNKFMERIEGMDEKDLQKLYRDREEMRKKWQEARDEGSVDEFWKNWAEDGGSRPHFNYGFGPPPEVMQKWIRLQQEGKSRREIFREMVGERMRHGERFSEHGRVKERWRARDGDEIRGGQDDGSWGGRADGSRGGRGEEGRGGQGEGGRGGRGEGVWEGRGEGGREGQGEGGWGGRGEGGFGGRGEGGWGGRGERGWGCRDEGGFGGRGEGGWRGRGRGWRGRGWNMLNYGVDPDRSYLFEQFNF
ncbi:hypothetical protein KP79_PYT13013 [Mizuhopecten yessoensis]|uniref:Uncharacterized protein n=1 Tax=Mizuhopecten yessoensis TaxID=6573 RepID=A0A210QBZ9_MIZYE|nr:hypothetical protein KP79_PYT13013 [Mizuhopecten yessoensis]